MKQNSLTGFVNEVIVGLQQEGRFSTANIYKYALRAFTQSVGGGEIFWGGLSRQALRHFQTYMEGQQKSYNTISTYIRALRAVYNRAVDLGLVKGEFRLFAKLKTGVASEKKLAVTASQMKKLVHAPGAEQLPTKVRQAQDILSLMVLLQGMPYTDLAHLHKSDLNGTLLTCHRQKTGTELCVKVVPEAMELIERYRNREAASPYLLNILSSTCSEKAAFEEYQRKLRDLNLQLSKLPALCGVEGIKVSSYTARHTWATLAKYCQVPEEVISEGLGHSSLEVTRTYLKSFGGDELEKANRIIIDYISTGNKNVWSRA
ncbi:tyrosine-type recombinase/integrase [Bacteroides oleiciplenus]|uniref:tyrosine-type recombinase/integrase n=1 Tax=Bacteroides oleiciplenus TaxID=626931 RepID=UPI0026DD69A9|nr:site-specific integrase [Bacteroides oleiciplenus]